MNNLKMFVSKIADRGRADSANTSRDEDLPDPTVSANSAEGFICPVCHLDLSSMETLQQHFESTHAEPPAASRDASKIINSTKSELEELKATVRLLQEQLEAERGHSSSVKEAMDDLKQTFLSKDGKETDLLAEYKAEIFDLRAKSESSISRLSALTVELAHARAELETKARDNEVLRNSMESRNESVSVLEKRLAEADSALREKDFEVSRLQETVAALKKSEMSATERIEGLTRTIEETRSAWENKVTSAEHLTAERDSMRIEFEQAKREISELKTSSLVESQRLMAQLDSQKQAVQALKKQIATAASSVSIGNQEADPTENEIASEFKALLEIDRVDDYTSFACHAEALQKISSETIRACRKLDDLLTATTPEEEGNSNWILKLLRIEDAVEGQDSIALAKSVLSTGFVPDELHASTSISQVDSFLGSLQTEDTKKEEIRRALIAGILLMRSGIVADAKSCGVDGVFGLNAEKAGIVASQANQVRKLCFALVDNAVEALKSLLEASNIRIDEEIQKSFQANSEKQSLSKELSGLRKEVETQQSAIQSYQKEINEKSKLFESCQHELTSKSDAVKKLESALEEKEQSVLSLAGSLQETEAKVAHLNESLVALKEAEAAEKSSLRLSLEKSQGVMKDLENQVVQVRLAEESLRQELSDARQNLTSVIEESQSALEAERRKTAALEERSKQTISTAANEVTSLMVTLCGNLEEKERGMSEMLDSYEGFVDRLTVAFSELKSVTNSAQNAVQLKAREAELVRVELAEEKEAQQEMKQMFVEEKMALQAQVEEKTRAIGELEERIDDMQASHASALSDVNELFNSTRKKLEIERNELDDVKGQLFERDQLLKTMRNQCDEMAAEKGEEISLLRTQLDDASGKRLELEALLSSENEEKRAILDRFASMEGEVVSLRAANADLHRKVNDVEAGLHELARENQALQVELAKTQNRKWMDDTGVEGCQACEKGFSLTVRKHHCRQCGKIYCHECSSKTATLPSFKKPARVCDKCYAELYP